MIYSMTGFASASLELKNASVTLELRSVNNRYLDMQFRLPDEVRHLEPVFREAISSKVTRGKLECRVSYHARETAETGADINLTLLHQLAQWSNEIQALLPTARELSVADILRWPGILENSPDQANDLQDKIPDLLQQVIQDFNAARAREGEKLKAFLVQRVQQINALRLQVAPRIPAAIKAFEEKLSQRLKEALCNHDDERIRQEFTLFSNRIDVDEELSRLSSHLTEIERILEKDGSAGKRLDFLMQELHREANTLGSKAADAEISRASIDMKILIEQMREQIQNIE